MPSDSLFSALLARKAEWQGAQRLESWVAAYQQGAPPFILSSTYPFAGDVRFFPVPANALRAAGAPSGGIKDMKRVAYLSEGLFHRVLAGETLAAVFKTATRLQGGSALADAAEAKKLPAGLAKNNNSLWVIEQRPRVTLDRASSASAIYQTGEVHFAPECGLWFGVQWLRDEPAEKANLAELLADLAISGLGGDRSAGLGVCQITPSGEIELPDPGEGCWISLSRYLPRVDEIQALTDRRAAYKLVEVGGWLQSPKSSGQRRRAARMLAEGAVLGPLGRTPPGEIVDVRPRYPDVPDPLGHAVYRCGLALAVGIAGG
jgi:CRISPR-associated protein Csm4